MWSSSDTTVASLSTDDPPIITAVAPGHVSITAGDASADVTVYAGYALPTGTVIWSAPGDGTGVSNILPAVPSSTGLADVFGLQSSGNVQAITTDGSVAWTASVGTGNALLPDFQGGPVVATDASIMRLDGMTGQIDSQYNYVGTPQSNVAVHTNGTIFAVDGSSLVGINPAAGTAIFTIPMEQSTYDESNACAGQPDTQWSVPPKAGQLIIAGDGNAYLTYQYTQYSTSQQLQNFCNLESNELLHSRLLQVDPSGNAQKIVIGDWSEAFTYIGGTRAPQTQNGQLPQIAIRSVTNADQGVLLSSQYYFPAYCSYETYPGNTETGASGCVPQTFQRSLITVSGGSITSNTMLSVGNSGSAVVPLLQGQDGNYFGVGLSSPTSMDHFDQNGNVMWSVPNFTPVMATSDGGVIARSATGQNATFDQNGVADGMLPQSSTYSWTNEWYSVSGAVIDDYLLPSVYLADAYLAVSNGNPSGTPTATKQPTNAPLPSCYDTTLKPPPACPGPREAINNAMDVIRSVLLVGPCPGCGTVFALMRSNNEAIYQPIFYLFLSRTPRFYDGTHSNANMQDVMCDPGFFNTCSFPSEVSVRSGPSGQVCF